MLTRKLADKITGTHKSILLLGPRQVGKSTLLKSIKPDLYINLANENTFINFTSDPSELEAQISERKPKSIFIDEIQRLPTLLNTIQDLIDQKKGLQFFLSGSSARKLKRGSANLLPGRLFNYRLGPLSCLELDFKMNTQRALELGTMPEPYLESREHAEKLLRSYTATYLHEEILAEALTRQVSGFSRFLKTAAENSGKFLDFSKMAARAKVNRRAARRYYDILEDTLICDRVEAYATGDLDLVKHPKYFFFDVGVVNGVLENFKSSTDRKGFLLEHLFFNQLINTSYCLDQNIKISHFRTRNGLEVDFVIENKDQIYLVEIKSQSPSESDLNPLIKALKYFPKSTKAFVACIKTDPRKIKGVRVLEWQEVIREIFKA